MQGTALQKIAFEAAHEWPAVEQAHPIGPEWDVFKVVGKVPSTRVKASRRSSSRSSCRLLRARRCGTSQSQTPAGLTPSASTKEIGRLMALSADRMFEIARDVASALDGVTNGRPFTPNLDVYRVASKVFMVITENEDRAALTLKCEPDRARALQREHESIVQGRYFDKKHWVTLEPGPGITQALVAELVDYAYDLVYQSLPMRERPAASS